MISGVDPCRNAATATSPCWEARLVHSVGLLLACTTLSCQPALSRLLAVVLPTVTAPAVSCMQGGAGQTVIETPNTGGTLWGITGAGLQDRIPVTQGGANLVANGVSAGCSC
jgi:hypothetical protein